EVKLFIADNTAGSPCGNVGHRQLFKFFLKAFPKLVLLTTFGEAFFLLFSPLFYFFIVLYSYLVVLYRICSYSFIYSSFNLLFIDINQ
ncbi:hypothetical protein, partial [Aliarcobacter butzleri]|uniref:hypothetical protein n=1 Tax=Aliarcobacter butzleri TaxID=28197 RepID=UPI003209CA97